MQRIKITKSTINICVLVVIMNLFSQPLFSHANDGVKKTKNESLFIVPNSSYKYYNIKTPRSEKLLEIRSAAFNHHPSLGDLFKLELKDSLVNEVKKRYNRFDKDTLTNKDLFYLWKPVYEWAYSVDPHFRVMPAIDAPTEKEKKSIYKYLSQEQKRIPITLCNINDSLIVFRSIDPQLKQGDLVLSINGVSANDYIKYSYRDRFITPYSLMMFYDFAAVSDMFELEILRNDKHIVVSTSGVKPSELIEQDPYNVKTYSDYNCGYIRINEFFPNNSYLIKRVREAIQEFKSNGIGNVVIDVRENPGGSGHSFDKLISIFTDKDVVPYMKNQTLRVSSFTQDYKFVKGKKMFENVEFPAGEYLNNIDLDPTLHISNVKYYILASKGTGSIAASLVNILNYNSIAVYCGEPLLRNAIKYGEVLHSVGVYENSLISPSISTVEFNEYSKAVDGVLEPDIHIPYVASEYMTGKDAVLEKLLEIIKNQ